MKFRINGKEEELFTETSLDSLVENKGLKREIIVIEHNLQIIAKENWSNILLAEGDNIEIVKFMGGG